MSTIEQRVINKIRLRAEAGLAKYGKSMERTDLSQREWLTHLQEELTDAAVYAERLLSEQTNQQKVEEFMWKAGQSVPQRLVMPDTHVQQLRYDLIAEELAELKVAQEQGDIVGIADAIADLLYVVYGAAVAYGLPAQQLFDEVHASNMSKFIDGHRRPDGKWIKGPSYRPAAIKTVLGLE